MRWARSRSGRSGRASGSSGAWRYRATVRRKFCDTLARHFRGVAMVAPALEISDARLRRLHDYWLGKKGDRIVPRRADIAPEEMVDVLPWVFLMERVGE